MGPQIPCRNSADPWENQCNKPYNDLHERFIRPTPSINRMPTVQGLYMEAALPSFNADLKIWYDKRAG